MVLSRYSECSARGPGPIGGTPGSVHRKASPVPVCNPNPGSRTRRCHAGNVAGSRDGGPSVAQRVVLRIVIGVKFRRGASFPVSWKGEEECPLGRSLAERATQSSGGTG